MQGSTGSRESKWDTYVIPLFKIYSADVVCLQEAGSPPESGEPSFVPAWLPGFQIPMGVMAAYFRWNIGTRDAPFYIYILWIQCDPGANRNNLAIASTRSPVNLIYTNPGKNGGRPGIGMKLYYNRNDINIFTLHAFSGGGNDAPELLSHIDETRLFTGLPWFAAGDYNRHPSTWDIASVPYNTALCGHDVDITHPGSGTNLDYAFLNPGQNVTGIVMNNFIASDHYPVAYDL